MAVRQSSRSGELFLTSNLLGAGGLLFLLGSLVGFDLLLCCLLMHGLRRLVAHNQFAFPFDDSCRCLPPPPVASVPTTTTTATTPIAAATAAAAASFFPGTRFIDRQCPALEILSAEHGNGFGCVGLSCHFDKSKPSGPTGLSVLHEVDRSDRPSLRE
jgi:hypothetical protein